MLVLLLLLIVGASVQASAFTQSTATVRIEVRSAAGAIGGARVIVDGQTVHTAADGRVLLTVMAGRVQVTVSADRFAEASVDLTIRDGETRDLIVTLDPDPSHEEEITVTATRTGKRLEEQPMRVEVLGREEIEEKMLMTPGDITMMLNEMGGMRVQATSPSLGGASVRIQGLRGRYTRFLSDGLPLFGEQIGSLGLLQIPPMDLGQVEVIKGVASSLYGAGAMGGVVNLVSRRPGPEQAGDLLVNRSTRGATDVVGFLSGPLQGKWSYTLLGGGHWQERDDVDDDGWADLPGYSRGLVRPRLFWDDGRGRSFFATTGITIEDRSGGTLPGRTIGGAPFLESLDTRRVDLGTVGQTVWRQRYVLTGRAALARQSHTHRLGPVEERDRHTTGFAELALRGASGPHTWVVGTAVEHDAYAPRDLPRFRYSFTVPGIFAQDDVTVASWLSASVSARLDRHNQYGTFFSPRLSTFMHSGPWSARVSGGTGFVGPTWLTEETETAGLSQLVVPGPLRAERGRSLSVDLTRTDGPRSYTATFFTSRVASPIHVDRAAGIVLTNLSEPTTIKGVELLGTLRHAPFAVTGTYTYVRSRETTEIGSAEVPLTPRHSAGLVAMWEREDVGRVGLEWYYTGAQRLEENPFRAESRPYVIVGLLVERQFGRWRLFVNGENLSDVRQTRWDPLIRPRRAPDGRWATDAWAPLDGRTINGGIRVRF